MEFQTIQTNKVRVRIDGRIRTFIKSLVLLACFSLAISTQATIPSSELPNPGLQFSASTINANLYPDTPATVNRMGVIIATTFDNQPLWTERMGANQTITTNQTNKLESKKTDNPVPEPRELILTGFAALLFHLARRRLTTA